jgi:surface polysaccharide O-acyltransferase-like enzyme
LSAEPIGVYAAKLAVAGGDPPPPVEAAAPPAGPRWMHYGDYLRIVGTIAVVVGHVSDMVLYYHEPLKLDWWVCNLWDASTRWAVPIYIMLSGALLLDPARDEPAGNFYRKRLTRIGVPLVFWSAFFMWFSVWYTGWTTPRQAWINLLVGQPYMHMHFIFRIAGLYAFTPMIRVFLRHVSRPMLIGTVALMLALSSADTVANNFTNTELSAFARFVPFAGYYLLGYMLRDGVRQRRTVIWCWVGFIGSIVVLAGGTAMLAQKFVIDAGKTQVWGPPSVVMLLYDFLSPVRVVMAICAWVVLVQLFRDPWPHSQRGQRIVRAWANTTLGLYLIHPVFREMWYLGLQMGGHEHGHRLLSHGIDATWPTVWIGVPLVATLVYLPSLLATVILMRIPYVRRITG